MSRNLKQKKPLASDPSPLEQTYHQRPPQSFSGRPVILKELTNWNFHLRQKVKLVRFRKCTISKQLLQNFKAAHTLKSLKSVKDITIIDPKETFPERHVSHFVHYVRKLTKVQKVQLVHPIYGTSYSTETCFSRDWDEIYKTLRSFNPKKIEFCLKNRRYGSFARGKLNWWQTIFRPISCMQNLGFLYINACALDWLQYSSKYKISNSINPIRKLTRLKEVLLGGLEELISESMITYKYFMEAPNLEKISVLFRKPNLSRPKAELIKNIEHLKELNAEGFFDIVDLIYLLKTCTGLQNVRILRAWHNNVENALKSQLLLEDLKPINIKHLSLDADISIRTAEVNTFYLKFLKTFVNLETLKIGFKWKNISFVNDYADVLASFKKLTRLELAISFSLEDMGNFFTKIGSITNLKHFVFASNVSFPKAIAKQLHLAIQPFKQFLLNQTGLESFQMHWHKIGHVFLQAVCEVMLELQNLRSINFQFGTSSEKYIQVHNTMLEEVANTVNKINNIQEIYITVVCGDHLKFQVPRSLQKCQNENLKKFRFETAKYFSYAPFDFNWYE